MNNLLQRKNVVKITLVYDVESIFTDVLKRLRGEGNAAIYIEYCVETRT